MDRAEPLLKRLLDMRVAKGKENPARLNERRGEYAHERPKGQLIWLHAASVGEAQSALILINALLNRDPHSNILVTTGTLSSAKRMEESLPDRAFHQFIPLDHPQWVAAFLDHWQPDCALWMESELWPNMLRAVKARNIPAVLINARLSKRSLKRWRLVKNSIGELLSSFHMILAQSDQDMRNFQSLGARHVSALGNLKYSASPLCCDESDFKAMQAAVGLRPVVVYASTHEGEENMIAGIHDVLENEFPDLLSIIIPRHPERGTAIAAAVKGSLRGMDKALPDANTRIYIADTLGEMGLFYRLSTIVYVGRSLSRDGGGGHNPLEPALLHCAVVHGSHVQNLRDIYDDMQSANACLEVANKQELAQKIAWLLNNDAARDGFIKRAHDFANTKSHVIDEVMEQIAPILEKAERYAA